MSNVAEIIASEIAGHGAISFARFMELALYCPIYGYYEKQEDTIGRRGDFFTSVSVGNLFGELLAWQFAEWLADPAAANPPGRAPNLIVEAGAHDGRLAADILTWLRGHRPAIFERLEYRIIEPSPRRRAAQQRALTEFAGHVQWAAEFDHCPGFGIHGIIFSNELFDSFPVHRFGWDARHQAWFEWGVSVREGSFVWTRLDETKSRDKKLPPDGAPSACLHQSDSVQKRLTRMAELLKKLPGEFTIEICPLAELWWRRAADALGAGRLLTIDYGLTTEEWIEPHRKNGTLRAFAGHRQNAEVLASPGDQDLTAHVSFSALQAAGEAAGLRSETFESQERFLAQIAAQISQRDSGFGDWTAARTRQFQTLTHPEHLGRAFRVLVQARHGAPTS